MKKFILFILILLGLLFWFFQPKILPYYAQLTQERVGLNVDLQPKAQKNSQICRLEQVSRVP